MSTRRITVEEVLEAYRVTGVTPGIGNMRCCAMGTVMMTEGHDVERTRDEDEVNIYWAVFGRPYAVGFTTGFDDVGGQPEFWTGDDLLRWEQGYIDGQNAHAAVFQKQGAQA